LNFIYVVGYKGSPNNIVLTKFNSLGTKLWEKAWVTSSTDRGIDLVTDSQNNIYIAGSSSSVGSIIIKCDSSGNQISNFTFQGTPKALGIDSTDSLYLGGDLSGSIIIAKFNNLGGHIWNRIWMGVGGTNCKDLILDSNGNIFLTGTMSGSSATYAYILTYDNNGNLIWTTSWGFDFPLTSTWNEGWGIASDSFDNLYLSGYSDFINWAYDESFLLKYVYGRLPQPFSLFSDADTPDVDGRFNLFWDPSIGAKSYSVYRYSYDITEINTSLVLLADHSAISPYPVSARNGTFYYIIVAHNETGNRRSNCVSVLVEIPYDAPGASNNFVIILLIIIIVVIVGVSGIVSYYQVVKKRGKFKPKRFKIKKERVIYIKKQILEIGTKFDRLQITEIAEICEEDSELISSIIKEMIKEGEIYAEYFEPSNTVNFDQQTIINEIDSLMASYKEWEIGKGKKK
jgi:hypothetical protein